MEKNYTQKGEMHICKKNKSKACSKRKSIFRAIMSLNLAVALFFPCSLTLAQGENKFDKFLKIVILSSNLGECKTFKEIRYGLINQSTELTYDIVLSAAAEVWGNGKTHMTIDFLRNYIK